MATNADKENYPKTNTAGSVAGTVGTFAAGGEIPVVAKALGMTGGSIGARILTSAAPLSGIGAADAAARGENPLTGALFGLGGSVAGPIAGKVIGSGIAKAGELANALMPTGVQGLSRAAANMLTSTIRADGPQAVGQKIATLGPEGMLADGGPSLTGITRGLAVKPDEPRSVIENALNSRQAGSNDRISNTVLNALGPAESEQMASQAIKGARADINSGYQTVHANAPPVDASDVISQIDSQLKTATGSDRVAGATKTVLENLRSQLIAKAPTDTSPAVLQDSSEYLHSLRQTIDGLLSGKSSGLGVERGSVASKDGNIMAVRKSLDTVLKDQVPGMAQVDASSRALAERANALDDGYNNILGPNSPHPEAFAASRAAAEPGVNVAQNKGIVAKIDRIFGNGQQRDVVKLNRLLAGGEDGYAAANLGTSFGPENANALLSRLAQEQQYGKTTAEAIGQSSTNRGQAAAKMLQDTDGATLDTNGASAYADAKYMAKRFLLNPLLNLVTQSNHVPRNLELAHALTATGPERDMLVNRLIQIANKQSAVSGGTQALANGFDGGVNRLLLGLSQNQGVRDLPFRQSNQ